MSLAVWTAAAFAVELWLKDVLAIGIFLCRIPVVLLGIFLANYEGRMPPKGQGLLGGQLVQLFFRWTRSKLLTNVLVFLILWGISLALAGLRRRIRNR